MSAGRYIHITDAETYRPIKEIVVELQTAEAEARRSDAALKKVLGKLGFSNLRGRGRTAYYRLTENRLRNSSTGSTGKEAGNGSCIWQRIQRKI